MDRPTDYDAVFRISNESSYSLREVLDALAYRDGKAVPKHKHHTVEEWYLMNPRNMIDGFALVTTHRMHKAGLL
jgi:hypothetical protein